MAETLNNDESLQNQFIELEKLYLSEEEVLQRYNEHENYNHQNNNELFQTVIDKCNSYLKYLFLTNYRTTKKKLSTDEFYLIVKNFYPIINVGINGDNCETYFYNYNSKQWSKNRDLFKQMLFRVRGNASFAKDVENIINGSHSDSMIPFKNITTNHDIEIIDDKFDATIDFNNGRYDFQTNTLTPITKSMMSINTLPYNLHANLTATESESFREYFMSLAEGNEDKADFFEQNILAIMLSYNPENKITMIQGNAGSGKSTYLDIILKMLGYTNTSMETNGVVKFSMSDFDKDDAISQIKNAKFLYSADNNDKIMIKNIEVFKSLCSGEMFSYFVKYGDRGYNAYSGPIMEVMNNIPSFNVGTDKQSITDRIHFITINKRIRTTNNEIKNFSEYFTKGDKKGKLARYLIDKHYNFTKFSYNEHEKIVEQLNDTDVVYQYVEMLENVNYFYNHKIPIAHLYDGYIAFCKQTMPNMSIKTQRNFTNSISQYLNDKFFILTKNPIRPSSLKKSYNHKELDELFNIDYSENKRPTRYFERQLTHVITEPVDSLESAYDVYFKLKDVASYSDVRMQQQLSLAEREIENDNPQTFIRSIEKLRKEYIEE